MGRLPEGTVTFLFTDIEGSTLLLQELGPAYADALVEHRARLREAFGRCRGVEVDTAGDSFFVAFASAVDAVQAARECQQALTGGRVRVRMGLHTGEPTVVSGGYVGIDVHRAARISAAAHGGQIVMSGRTRSLLADQSQVKDLGMHRLKDLVAPEHLYQVGAGDFPPLRTLNASNLPTQPTPLIGRVREVGEVAALLQEHRVVTLTGPGGTGKTRLAIQTAAELIERFPDGVLWVPLAAVEDPEQVLPAIGEVIGSEAPVAELIDERTLLAVLDNLEQVLDAAPYLSTLVQSCPNLRLLVTSRAPLRITGEREYAVDPLPDADAVELFRERAFDEQTSAVIAEICRRVDRLPLAVELAAARTRLFTPAQLLERLDQRLPMLTDGRRDAPPRHRALRDTIAWSYDLLDAEARGLYEQLGVFVGSFDLEAAEAVAAATLDGLEALVEASLIRAADGRFTMLETIREFALDRLEKSGDSTETRERHLHFFLAFCEAAALGIYGPDPAHWLRRCRADEDNVRAALAWAVERGAADEALRLSTAAARVWFHRSRFVEGLLWLDRALALAGGADESARLHALVQRGRFLLQVHRPQESLEQLQACVTGWRELGDEMGLTMALLQLGSTLVIHDPGQARAALEEARVASARVGYERGEEVVCFLLGVLNGRDGDLDAARTYFEQALDVARDLQSPLAAEASATNLAEVEFLSGRLDRAQSLYREVLENAWEMGSDRTAVECLAGLASVAARLGDAPRAARLWQTVEAFEASVGWLFVAGERERHSQYLQAVPPWTGEPLDLDEAVRMALEDGQAGRRFQQGAPRQRKE